MVIGPDKMKIMTNNSERIEKEIKKNDKRLDEVKNFRIMESINSYEGPESSNLEILYRATLTPCTL